MLPAFEDLMRRLQTDLSGLTNTLQTVFAHPFIGGRLLSGTILAGEQFVILPHGLGKPYTGAIILGVAHPYLVTVDLPGAGSNTTVMVQTFEPILLDLKFKLWVF